MYKVVHVFRRNIGETCQKRPKQPKHRTSRAEDCRVKSHKNSENNCTCISNQTVCLYRIPGSHISYVRSNKKVKFLTEKNSAISSEMFLCYPGNRKLMAIIQCDKYYLRFWIVLARIVGTNCTSRKCGSTCVAEKKRRNRFITDLAPMHTQQRASVGIRQQVLFFCPLLPWSQNLKQAYTVLISRGF